MDVLSASSARRVRRAVWFLFGVLCAAMLSVSIRRLLMCAVMALYAQAVEVDRQIQELGPRTVPAQPNEEGAFEEPREPGAGEPKWLKPAPGFDQAAWHAKMGESLEVLRRMRLAVGALNALRIFEAILCVPLIFGVYRLTPADANTPQRRTWIRSVALITVPCSLGVAAEALPGGLPGFDPELARTLAGWNHIVQTIVVYWTLRFAAESLPYARTEAPDVPAAMPLIIGVYLAGLFLPTLAAKSVLARLAGFLAMSAAEAYLLYYYWRAVRWVSGELTAVENDPPPEFHSYDDYGYDDADEPA